MLPEAFVRSGRACFSYIVAISPNFARFIESNFVYPVYGLGLEVIDSQLAVRPWRFCFGVSAFFALHYSHQVPTMEWENNKLSAHNFSGRNAKLYVVIAELRSFIGWNHGEASSVECAA